MRDLQISARETDVIMRELEQALALDGDVVEFGCYAGDTSVQLAAVMRQYPEKWLWLYDSFEGLPAKTAEDNSAAGWRFKPGELRADLDAVAHKFRKMQLPDPVIKKAWFNDLDPENDLPAKICFALFDGDFYESIKTSFELVAPKLEDGGIIVVHDYRNPELPGSARAVNEFLAQNPSYKLRSSAGLAIIDKAI